MPDAATPNAAAETEIDDSLPKGAVVVSDSDEMIGSLLARFGIGPELNEESSQVISDAPQPPAPSPAVAKAAAGDITDPPAENPAEPATPETPVEPEAPKGFTPEQEAEIAARIEAKAKEFEPIAQERDELASAVEELQAKLAQQTNPAAMPKEIDPLLLEDDFNALAKQEADAERILEWCDQHEDTGFEPTRDGERAFAPAEVRKLRRQVEAKVNKLLPQARQLAQARAAKRAEARKAYPELFDGKSDAHKIRLGMKAKAPWLYAVFPQFDLWLGHMLEGEKAYASRSAKTSATTAPAPKLSVPPKPPTPPVLPSPGGAPLSTTNAARKARTAGIDANEFLARGGNRDALISVLRESGIN